MVWAKVVFFEYKQIGQKKTRLKKAGIKIIKYYGCNGGAGGVKVTVTVFGAPGPNNV